MEFKKYARTNLAEMRPYVPGEDLSKVSVSNVDTPEEGGFVARNPENHDDQWYVAKDYAEANFDLASNAHAPVKGYKALSEAQLAWMNEIKEMAKIVGEVVDAFHANPELFDGRWTSIAKTDLQKGFMALTRAAARPDFF